MAAPSDEDKHKKDVESPDGRAPDGRRNERAGRAYPREDTPPAQCSVLCGPRSCSTLPASINSQNDDDSPPEPKRRRLWGLRGLVKMFRRRVKRKGGDPSGSPQAPAPTLRARSASELTVDQANRSSGGPYNQGLSVSHDSVFSPDSPPEPTHTAPPALALATRGVNMAELKAALRRRRGGDSGSGDDDPGLPLSPQTSPTTLDVLNHGLKSCSRTTQSTCSDGSLLSMGSSENDEDSFGAGSNHSSKACLVEGRYQVVDHEPAAGSAPLSHKAARHKIAVKPRRTHGVPRSRRQPQVLPSSLPTTPEVNEDFSAKVVDASEGANLLPKDTVRSRLTPTFTPVKKDERVGIPLLHDDISDGVGVIRPLGNSPSEISPEREAYGDHLPPRPHEFSSGIGRKHSRGAGDASSKASDKNTGRHPEEHPSRYRREAPLRKSGTGGKSGRQKSDPSHLPERGSDVEMRRTQAKSKNQNGSQRSSSVEGRLEGHEMPRHLPPPLDTHQLEKSIQQTSKENLASATVAVKAVSQQSNFLYTEAADTSRSPRDRKQIPSPYDNIHSDVSIRKQPSAQSNHSLESFGSEGTPGERSSTDSLTTTPLPGIYIRSSSTHSKMTHSVEHHATYSENTHVTSQAKPSSHFTKERTQQEPEAGGPLSLDSSLTLVHQEETLRKTSSVDHVSISMSEGKTRNDHSQEVIQSNKSVLRSVSVASSTPTTPGSRSRNNSLGDELEKEDLGKVALRKIKREHSLKKTETESSSLPEFMRIQLNKVQSSKGNSIVFNTEQLTPNKLEQPKPVQNISDRLEAKPQPNVTTPKMDDIERQKQPVEVFIEEKPKEIDEKVSTPTMPQDKSKEETFYTSTVVTTSHTHNPIHKLPPKEEALAKDDETFRKKEERKHSEEIVLRRPSVLDRSAVIDQSLVGGHSSPTPKEEPELFKVFARRSFKIKDSDADPSLHDESDKEITKIVEPSSPVPVQGISTIEGKVKPSAGGLSHTEAHSQSFSSTKSVQTKRFPVSSPLPYSSTKVTDPKPTIIVLSGKEPSAHDPSSQDVKKSQPPETSTQDPDSKLKKFAAHPFKSQSSTQYTVYKSKAKHDSQSTELSDRPDDTLPQAIDSNKPLPKIESRISGVDRSRNSFNKFADGLMGPGSASTVGATSDPKEDSSAQPDCASSVLKGAKRSFSNVRRKEDAAQQDEIKSSGSGGGFVKPSLARTASLPWQSKETQMEELVVSHLPPSTTPSSNSQSGPSSPLPASKILDSFASQSDSNTLKSVSSTDSLGSKDASSSSDQDDVQNQDTKLASCDKDYPSSKTFSGGASDRRRSISPVLAEAKNSTITPFSQQLAGSRKPSPKDAPLFQGDGDHCQRQHSLGRNSLGGGIAEDWRVLVRQRREDRLKQTKTPDTEEIIIEQSRPTASRNSKVLEMANNFQKLQVA